MADTFKDEAFTVTVSRYLNTFINDIAEDKEKLLRALEKYPGKNHVLIQKAIQFGPEELPQDDPEVCKSLFNFIEYYSTGKFSDNLDIEFTGKVENV